MCSTGRDAPGATVGPATRISPSAAIATRVQNSGAPERCVDLRAGLGQPVGRRDRDAGRGRALQQRGGDRRAAQQRPAQRGRVAQPGVEQPRERRRHERDDASGRPASRSAASTRSVSKRSCTTAVVA